MTKFSVSSVWIKSCRQSIPAGAMNWSWKKPWSMVHSKPKAHAIQNYEAIETISKQKKPHSKESKTSRHSEMGPKRGERERRWVYHPLELYHESCPVLILKRILKQYTSLQQTLPSKSPWEGKSEKTSQRPDPIGPGSFCASPHSIWQLDHYWKRSWRGPDH